MSNTDNLGIVKYLLENDGERIRPYFNRPVPDVRDDRIRTGSAQEDQGKNAEAWVAEFRGKYERKTVDHDEPWLTLVALYGLFGDQKDLDNPKRLAAVNSLFSSAFARREGSLQPPPFGSLLGAHVEVFLPEVKRFRDYLYSEVFDEASFHPYPDVRTRLEKKCGRRKASLEGNTHLDALVSGKSGERSIHVFIEAKYLSDISKDIMYVPVRNQIARNIDSAIALMSGEDTPSKGLGDFWFLLLTPGMFRTPGYGGPEATPLAPFGPERSRLYCYKLEEYLDWRNLRRDLPHRTELTDSDWRMISSRIGWLTFEDIHRQVVTSGLLEGAVNTDFDAFFRERCLALPATNR